MSDTIKPCPYCGNVPSLSILHVWFVVGCSACKVGNYGHQTAEAAVKAWNEDPRQKREAQ